MVSSICQEGVGLGLHKVTRSFHMKTTPHQSVSRPFRRWEELDECRSWVGRINSSRSWSTEHCQRNCRRPGLIINTDVGADRIDDDEWWAQYSILCLRYQRKAKSRAPLLEALVGDVRPTNCLDGPVYLALVHSFCR